MGTVPLAFEVLKLFLAILDRSAGRAMTRSENLLYHQIHPLKLGTDIVSASVSLRFFWQHLLILGMAIHLLPPIVASVVVIRWLPLERQRDSAFGHYLAAHMSHAVEAVRLAGGIVMVVGAWYRDWALILLGAVMILAAWCHGLVQSEPRKQ